MRAYKLGLPHWRFLLSTSIVALVAFACERQPTATLEEGVTRLVVTPEQARVRAGDSLDLSAVAYDRQDAAGETRRVATFADLLDPRWRGRLVVQDPATSSPGLQFLVSTVAYPDATVGNYKLQVTLIGRRRDRFGIAETYQGGVFCTAEDIPNPAAPKKGKRK